MCGYKRKMRNIVTDHIKFKHLNMKIEYDCGKCDFITNNRDALWFHNRRNHAGKSKKNCELCEYSTSDLRNLSQHIQSVHEGIQFTCEDCGKTYLRLKALDHHKLVAHSDNPPTKPFQCTICCKSYYRRDELNDHVISSHGEKLFKCDLCLYSTSLEKRLKKHKISHEPRSVNCEDCEFKTSTKKNLMLHIDRHHNNITLSCKICSYKCKSKIDFQSHNKRKHDQTFKGYECDQCNYKAERKDYLNTHIRSLHDKVRFQCHLCEYQATRKQYLTSHLGKIH